MPGDFDFLGNTVEGANALTARWRANAAYDALNKAYGPAVANDPANAFKAAQASAEIPLAPQTAQTTLGQSQANLDTTTLANKDTAGTQQRLAAYRATQMLKSAAGPDGSIPPDAYDKIVRPNAALLGIDPAHVDSFGQTLASPQGAQHLDTIAQALIGPTKVTGATSYGIGPDGQPVAITRDQYGNVHQQSLNGTEVVQQQRANQGQQNADTGVVRAQTGRMVANTGRMREGVYAANQPFGAENPVSGMAPAPNNGPVPSAVPAAPGPPPNSLFSRLPPKGKQAAIGAATSIVNTGTNLANTNQIIGNVLKQISPYTAGTGSLLKELPGSQQADLKANLATLKAQGLMSWISSLKNQNGQTGIGRVLQSEANAATNLYGNMEQDQSAKQLAFHAKLFQQTVNRLYDHSNKAFTAMYGIKPHQAIGTEDPDVNNAGGAQLPAGWKYLGPKK